MLNEIDDINFDDIENDDIENNLYQSANVVTLSADDKVRFTSIGWDDLADILDQLDLPDNVVNAGWTTTRCPNHTNHKNGDANPSFSINLKKDKYCAWVKVHCHVCSDTDEILKQLNAPIFRYLSDEKRAHIWTDEFGNPTIRAWIIKKMNDKGQLEKGGKLEYWYADKFVSPWKLPEGFIKPRRILYKWPEIIKALDNDPEVTISITEGEKDADTLWSLGIPATTCGSARRLPKEAIEVLKRFKSVHIYEDNDGPGRENTKLLISKLYSLDKAFKVVRFDVKDVTDWINLGNTHTDLVTHLLKIPLLDPTTINQSKNSFYYNDKTGLYFYPAEVEIVDPKTKVGTGVFERPEPVKLGNFMEVLGIPMTLGGTEPGRYVRVIGEDRRYHTVYIPSDILESRSVDLPQLLRRMGGYRNNIDKPLNIKSWCSSVSNYLVHESPDTYVYVLNARGWHVLRDGTKIFATPGAEKCRIASTEDAPEVLLPDINPEAYLSTGTLQEWKDNVAAYAVGNPLQIFAMSMAFVGPILSIISHESFGGNMNGTSGTGKSTTRKMAGTVIGNPNLNWRSGDSTVIGLGAFAVEKNNDLLILDELHLMGNAVSNIPYILANGIQRNRANTEGGLKDAKPYSIAFLLSGEESFEAIIGDDSRLGQAVRLIDIRVPKPEEGGVIESLNSKFNSSGEQIKHLESAVNKYYGTAFNEYIKKLLKAGDDLIQRYVLQQLKEFKTNLGYDSKTSDIQRVIGHLGVVSAAGELATALSITGWPKEAVKNSLYTIYRRWEQVNVPGDKLTEDERIICELKEFLISNSHDFLQINYDRSNRRFVLPGGEVERKFSEIYGFVHYDTASLCRNPTPEISQYNAATKDPKYREASRWFVIPEHLKPFFKQHGGQKKVGSILKKAGILDTDGSDGVEARKFTITNVVPARSRYFDLKF